jgi:RNA polymerase sigma-70 factor, ECF subfamily
VVSADPPNDPRPADVAAAGEQEFTALFERHRRELQLHCYRMLGSYEASEDLVQETFLRAWRARASYEGRASFRTWLYRIATNACLDALARERRRPSAVVPLGAADADSPGGYAEIPWLEPFPDQILDEILDPEAEPDSTVVAKETVELAFLAAIQHLPPTQRAVLILRDVLGWSARETAALLETSVASANSALQRARHTLRRRLPERRAEWSRDPDASEEERELLRRYVEAHERADVAAFAELLSDEATFSMPPEPTLVIGRDEVMSFLRANGFGTPAFADLKLVPLRANRQPAAANYRRAPGDSLYRPMALDVLRFERGQVVELTAFDPKLFEAFGLPPAAGAQLIRRRAAQPDRSPPH